jgi:beta-N-acetylhexosaminidase
MTLLPVGAITNRSERYGAGAAWTSVPECPRSEAFANRRRLGQSPGLDFGGSRPLDATKYDHSMKAEQIPIPPERNLLKGKFDGATGSGLIASMTIRAFITGLAGTTISSAERSFLRQASPWGLILFERNIKNRGQVKALVDDFYDTLGYEAAVLIDQEGGRVQRLGPPHWRAYPTGAQYGWLYDRDPVLGLAAAKLGARLIAGDLSALGITVNCLPVADVPVPGSDPVIGDRAYGNTPDKVAQIAGAIADGLLEGGVLPVLKHLPGHGRASCDSHFDLPVVAAPREVLEPTDFEAFRRLAHLPIGMTAHVMFTAIDPERPSTQSPVIINEIIRGAIGFDGLLMSDDVSMGALSGRIADRTSKALAAGCDIVLHCNGNMKEMEEVAAASCEIAGDALARSERALAARRGADAMDLNEARITFSRMMGQTAAAG